MFLCSFANVTFPLRAAFTFTALFAAAVHSRTTWLIQFKYIASKSNISRTDCSFFRNADGVCSLGCSTPEG